MSDIDFDNLTAFVVESTTFNNVQCDNSVCKICNNTMTHNSVVQIGCCSDTYCHSCITNYINDECNYSLFVCCPTCGTNIVL